MPLHTFKSANGVKVIYTRSADDRGKVGVHLIDPTDTEFENAESRAASNGFTCIYIHLVDVGGCA